MFSETTENLHPLFRHNGMGFQVKGAVLNIGKYLDINLWIYIEGGACLASCCDGRAMITQV